MTHRKKLQIEEGLNKIDVASSNEQAIDNPVQYESNIEDLYFNYTPLKSDIIQSDDVVYRSTICKDKY